MRSVDVVGIGPGHPDYLTRAGQNIIAAAQVVAGFESVLGVVASYIEGESLVMDYRNQESMLNLLAQRADGGERCVVCAHGDASFSGSELVDRVRKRFREVRVTPGISSVQIAAARAGISFEQSVFLTLHRRYFVEESTNEMTQIVLRGNRHAIVLPKPWDLMPAQIAQLLIDSGVEADRQVQVLQRLTLPDEQIERFSIGELAAVQPTFSDLSIVIVHARVDQAEPSSKNI